jgi:Ca2+-transporting ATPase
MPAVQLLWLNLIMDTLAALALATDFPTRTLLERKPERKDSAFITTPMWKQIIGQAIYQLIIVFMMLFAGPPGLFPYLSEGLMASMESHWATVIFNAFVWMQIFNAFNCRRIDNHLNIFEAITKNWYFAAILAVMIGGQFLIIFVGGVALQVVRLNVYEWIVSIIPGLLVFPVGVLIRLFPDNLARSCVPLQFRNWVAARRTKKMMREMSGPQFDPEAQKHGWDADALMNDLKFLKKYKGGRMDSLRFKMAHPKQSKTVNTSVTALLAGGGIVAGGVGGLKGRRLS